jgi:hypothetical protein
MNFEELTEIIATEEGKKRSVNIAQIKEITKITLSVLALIGHEKREKLIAKYSTKDQSCASLPTTLKKPMRMSRPTKTTIVWKSSVITIPMTNQRRDERRNRGNHHGGMNAS